jgi:hypothetical protein
MKWSDLRLGDIIINVNQSWPVILVLENTDCMFVQGTRVLYIDRERSYMQNIRNDNNVINPLLFEVIRAV